MAAATSFLQSFGLAKGSVVSLVGAGGKTSLLFHLAAVARDHGYRALVSTTTKMLIPKREQYDELDLTGSFVFSKTSPGIYVVGRPLTDSKMQSVSHDTLDKERRNFDIVLLEADGAAGKSLKGWLPKEPVISAFTSHTIGVVDITTVGQIVDDTLVHRLEPFCKIAKSRAGDRVGVNNLHSMITHDIGLFFKARGKRIVFINKVESTADRDRAEELAFKLEGYHVCIGSVHREKISRVD